MLRALLFAVTSLWPQKVGSRGEIYSARWKLRLISDQAMDLVKNCLEGGGLHVSLSTTGLHPASWINRLCESRKVSVWRFMLLLCDLPKVLTNNLRYVLEHVLPENFVPSIKALRECLVRWFCLRKPNLCSKIVAFKSSVFDRLSYEPHDMTD